MLLLILARSMLLQQEVEEDREETQEFKEGT